MTEEMLILVNEDDQETGSMEKMKVHELGLLHRAFSLFVFNSKGELLLQQRADSKYHSPGLWTNTCCSHPRHGENLDAAIRRRITEEMGMDCEFRFAFSFIYRVQLDDLIEHEFDHVYFAKSDQVPNPNPGEVKAWKYMDPAKLQESISSHPESYTMWLKICYPQVIKLLQEDNI